MEIGVYLVRIEGLSFPKPAVYCGDNLWVYAGVKAKWPITEIINSIIS
jgi:hypothetical protein